MKTINDIYLDLKESDYCINLNGITFYFSSKVYAKKFKNNVHNFVESETLKLEQKYKVDISFKAYLQIVFYKKIEKRGFRIKIFNKEFSEKDIIIFTNVLEKSKDYAE